MPKVISSSQISALCKKNNNSYCNLLKRHNLSFGVALMIGVFLIFSVPLSGTLLNGDWTSFLLILFVALVGCIIMVVSIRRSREILLFPEGIFLDVVFKPMNQKGETGRWFSVFIEWKEVKQMTLDRNCIVINTYQNRYDLSKGLNTKAFLPPNQKKLQQYADIISHYSGFVHQYVDGIEGKRFQFAPNKDSFLGPDFLDWETLSTEK